MSKLSPAQFELLTHAVACGKATCVPEYAPRIKLIALGFAKECQGRFSTWIEPTESGIAALQNARRKAEGKAK
jgi:hypothetical protein